MPLVYSLNVLESINSDGSNEAIRCEISDAGNLKLHEIRERGGAMHGGYEFCKCRVRSDNAGQPGFGLQTVNMFPCSLKSSAWDLVAQSGKLAAIRIPTSQEPQSWGECVDSDIFGVPRARSMDAPSSKNADDETVRQVSKPGVIGEVGP
ncbi:hypothetical protein NM208_g15951 [Fusarium decemcellulare]|uniref:Uncharacterized protein n=1 Tax=Fusarium decemcellulare TaxID=57161 RepID=A0ACC1RFS6_9HYPO|nr:hypothetical protein NM208_g15951 [Fusarium decemcellulare]